MAKAVSGISFIRRDSFMHRLTGVTKLILLLCMSIGVMIGFDTRYLVISILLSAFLFKLSAVKLKEIRFIVTLMVLLLVLNNLAIFLFAPEQGVSIYMTRHVLAHLAGGYYLTSEQLFYQLNVTLKYFAIIPVGLIFFTASEPSEFAASLHTLGVNYKIAYAVSLSLRYIPDMQRSFIETSQAQQARGADISRKASLRKRIKGAVAIIFPLIFSSLDRIETVSNAMELRGFGRMKRRTWYSRRPFKRADYVMAAAGAVWVLIAAAMIIIDGGRFYNPFISY